MSARLTQTELNAGWWAVNCCDGKFKGTNTSHCTVCHNTFSGISGFDRHRSRGKCLNPAKLRAGVSRDGGPVFRDAGRKYQCWAFAISGPQDDEE